MKNLFIILLLLAPVHLFIAYPASADPRMETNKNFCHFILNPDNTDNEVFFAGCNSVITVVEKVQTAGEMEIRCEDNYTASGYGTKTELIPLKAAPVPPGTTLTLTSNESTTPCTMVESNGRAYKSLNWQSTIIVSEPKKNGLVRVQYELSCQDGQQ